MSSATETEKDIIKIILSSIIPPLGVAAEFGISKQFWISVILTMFGYIPGLIYAVYIISRG